MLFLEPILSFLELFKSFDSPVDAGVVMISAAAAAKFCPEATANEPEVAPT